MTSKWDSLSTKNVLALTGWCSTILFYLGATNSDDDSAVLLHHN